MLYERMNPSSDKLVSFLKLYIVLISSVVPLPCIVSCNHIMCLVLEFEPALTCLWSKGSIAKLKIQNKSPEQQTRKEIFLKPLTGISTHQKHWSAGSHGPKSRLALHKYIEHVRFASHINTISCRTNQSARNVANVWKVDTPPLVE